MNVTPSADVVVTPGADLVGPGDPSGTGAWAPRPGRRTASTIATGRQLLDGKPTRTAGAPGRRGAEAARQHPWPAHRAAGNFAGAPLRHRADQAVTMTTTPHMFRRHDECRGRLQNQCSATETSTSKAMARSSSSWVIYQSVLEWGARRRTEQCGVAGAVFSRTRRTLLRRRLSWTAPTGRSSR